MPSGDIDARLDRNPVQFGDDADGDRAGRTPGPGAAMVPEDRSQAGRRHRKDHEMAQTRLINLAHKHAA